MVEHPHTHTLTRGGRTLPKTAMGSVCRSAPAAFASKHTGISCEVPGWITPLGREGNVSANWFS